jgi:Flp pilus assembly protein TadG
MMRTPRSQSQRGAALVEFALVVPLLLVVIAGIVDFGFLFQRYEVVTNAAREGARLGTLPGYTDVSVRSHVRNYVQQGLALNNSALAAALPTGTPDAVDVTYPNMTVDLGGGATSIVPGIRVQVTYKHSFLLLGPMLGLINKTWGSNIDIVGVSQMRIEVPAAAGS